MKTRFSNGHHSLELDPDAESGQDWRRLPDGRHVLRIGMRTWLVDSVVVESDTIRFRINGEPVRLNYQDENSLLLDKLGFRKTAASSTGILKAPMPGRIVSVNAAAGDIVEAGQRLAVLEAMKMENELRAPIRGSILAVHVAAGQSVEKNTVIIEIKPLG